MRRPSERAYYVARVSCRFVRRFYRDYRLANSQGQYAFTGAWLIGRSQNKSLEAANPSTTICRASVGFRVTDRASRFSGSQIKEQPLIQRLHLRIGCSKTIHRTAANSTPVSGAIAALPAAYYVAPFRGANGRRSIAPLATDPANGELSAFKLAGIAAELRCTTFEHCQ